MGKSISGSKRDAAAEKNPAADSIANFWDVFRSVAFALAILLFFIGWVYLSYYFKYFGLSIYEINTEFFTYYLYGFYVAKEKLMAVVLLSYFAASLLIYYRRSKIKAFYLVIAVLVITLFPVSFFLAKKYAKDKVISILTWKETSPPIVFSFKKDFLSHHFRKDTTLPASLYSRYDSIQTLRLMELSSQFQLRKFYETPETFFVFYNQNFNDTLSYDIKVYQISKKDIDFSFSANNLSSLQNFLHEKD